MLHSDRLKIIGPLLLLFFVYLFILFQLSNFTNTFMHPEFKNIEAGYLKTGMAFTKKDFINVWDWRIDEEGYPRTTRWLSWFMDLVNVKFRVWLWRFILPHPSFSITWLWSLIINPWLLFVYLRKKRISKDIALIVIAFYLMTPYVLSSVFVLFRTGKILAHFFMLLALVMVSLNEEQPSKETYFVGFCLSLMLGAFCDETAFIIIPMICFLHPEYIFRKMRWVRVLLILLLIGIAYGWGISHICHFISGAPLLGLSQYDAIEAIFKGDYIVKFLNNLGTNSLAPMMQIMGLVVFHSQAPLMAIVFYFAGALSWGVLITMVFMRKDFWNIPLKRIFPLLAVFFSAFLFHNFLMSSVCNQKWGSYHYGSFFSIIFALALAEVLKFLQLNNVVKILLMVCILSSMGNTFLYTEKFIKNVLWYEKGVECFIFDGTARYFDPAEKPLPKDAKLKSDIYTVWADRFHSGRLPSELSWLFPELNSLKSSFLPTKRPVLINLTIDDVLDVDGYLNYSQDMTPSGHWDNDDQVFYNPSRAGAMIRFLLRSQKAYKGNLALHLTTAFDAGLVKVSLNDVALKNSPIDLYSPGIHNTKYELRNISFAKGDNILTFQVIGKNSKSKGMCLGIDTIEIY